MPAVRYTRFLGGLLILGIAMLSQALIPTPGKSMLQGAILDAGHVPLFALCGFLVLRLSKTSIGWRNRAAWGHYLIAFSAVVVLGLGTEFVQMFGSRDAGFVDFGRDLLGGSAVLFVVLAFDRERIGSRWWVRVGLVLAAVLLVAAGLYEVLATGRDYVGRNGAFPSICGFDSAWENRFVHGHDAGLSRVPPPAAWAKESGNRVGLVSFRVAAYPGLGIHEPVADWSGFAALEFEIFSSLDAARELVVRIHDAAHDNRYTDRFNRVLIVRPGANRYSIPLAEVEIAPSSRRMDMHRIRGVTVFADRPDQPFSLWFDGFSLIRG